MERLMKYIETLAAWNQATAQTIFTTLFVTGMFLVMSDLSDELNFVNTQESSAAQYAQQRRWAFSFKMFAAAYVMMAIVCVIW